jgi:sugar/nucleoside kinase (ribokinase family)
MINTVGQGGRPHGVFVGLATLDCIYRVATAPGPNEKITALGQEIAAGGPAANAAVTFALLGGDATLVTDLGRHPFAGAAREDLESYGVAVIPVDPTSPAPPAVSSIAVTERTGDRSVVSVNATDRSLRAPDWLHEIVGRAQVLLIDGHHPALAVAAAGIARAARVPVLLDAGSWKPVFEYVLRNVDVAVCSADLRLRGGGMGDPGDVAEAIAAFGVRRVAISRGPEPILWWEGFRSGSVAVPAVRARDTLAAGDVLHGAVAFALATGAPFVEALARAGAIAAQKCTHVGPSAWRRALRRS